MSPWATRRWCKSCCRPTEAQFSDPIGFFKASMRCRRCAAVAAPHERVAADVRRPLGTAVGGSGREALYNAPPFGALRDDPWSAVTMGRFAPRLKPLLFDIPGGAGRLMHPWVRACACLLVTVSERPGAARLS